MKVRYIVDVEIRTLLARQLPGAEQKNEYELCSSVQADLARALGQNSLVSGHVIAVMDPDVDLDFIEEKTDA